MTTLDSWPALDAAPDAQIVGMIAREGAHDGSIRSMGKITGVIRDLRNGRVTRLAIEETHNFTYRGETKQYYLPATIHRLDRPIIVD